jgi:hypothetical protein
MIADRGRVWRFSAAALDISGKSTRARVAAASFYTLSACNVPFDQCAVSRVQKSRASDDLQRDNRQYQQARDQSQLEQAGGLKQCGNPLQLLHGGTRIKFVFQL